jgi:hypothetical protein
VIAKSRRTRAQIAHREERLAAKVDVSPAVGEILGPVAGDQGGQARTAVERRPEPGYGVDV